jgi:hypothetical protein
MKRVGRRATARRARVAVREVMLERKAVVL